MHGMACRLPSVIRIAYTKRKVIESFVRPGWTNKKTLQRPDIIKLFSTLKRDWSSDERDKWECDIPGMIKDFANFGDVSENKFDTLEYGIDTDWNGNEHRLGSNIATQHH